MDFLLGLIQLIGVHTILGLSAYVVLLTNQITMAQAGFFSIGAYVSALLTVLLEWHLVPALLFSACVSCFFAVLVGFPALRVKGLMLVVATIAFGEFIRLFWLNFFLQVPKNGLLAGPEGGEGFKHIRFFPENGWTTGEVAIFIWAFALLIILALWWVDHSRAGLVLRAVGADEMAAQSVGINLTAVKVSAFAAGGFIAGVGGALYAHYTTHIEHMNFGIMLSVFAIAYPILGGLRGIFGTVLAVLLIQGVFVEGLRFLGDWRSLLFGALIVLVMNFRPNGLVNDQIALAFSSIFRRGEPRD